MFAKVILYKCSVYISHKNNSKKKDKIKTPATKLYKRQTVITSYLIIFRKKKKKHKQFNSLEWDTKGIWIRSLLWLPRSRTLPCSKYWVQAIPNSFLEVKCSLLTGLNAQAFPATWWIALPLENRHWPWYFSVCLGPSRGTYTDSSHGTHVLYEWMKKGMNRWLRVSARNRPKTPVRQWGRQASSGSLLAGYFPHIWSLLLQLLWRESGKGTRMASERGKWPRTFVMTHWLPDSHIMWKPCLLGGPGLQSTPSLKKPDLLAVLI